MTDMSIYLGRPGDLAVIPHPRNGVQRPRTRPTAVFGTGQGTARVSTVVDGARQYVLSWAQLQYATYSLLEAFHQGHEGPGPFALLDPSQQNWLLPNQASATSVVNDTDNFSVSGSGYTLSSDATVYRRGPRSLKVAIAYASQTGTVTLDPPTTSWYGVPVVDRDIVFSYWAKGAGSDPTVILIPTLTWYDTAGSSLSTSTGTPTVTTSADWTQMSVTDSPPASAAYVGCSIVTSAGSISAASVLYLDQLQLEQGTAPGTWYPGTGVRPVQVVSLTDSWPFRSHDLRDQVTLTLQEVV